MEHRPADDFISKSCSITASDRQLKMLVFSLMRKGAESIYLFPEALPRTI